MMIATECPPADRLRALAHGRLSDEQSDLLFDHVRGCDACRSELETLHDDGDSLIVTLRGGDGAAGLDDKEGFDEEPGCRVAVAKALGALARSAEGTTGPISEALPRVIGEYEVVRPLGRGGMGSVYLARHTKLGRSVAIKVLAGHRLADARMRERFDAEMRAIGRLSHPNVVSAFDAREVDGTAVLVTEYIDGFDLGELVARVGPLSVADGCEIGRRVAEALAYTSGEGFVHRDVKPSNVMLGRDGGVKLLDLGLARFQVDGVDPADSDAEPDCLGGATSGGGALGGVGGGGMTGTGQTMGTADYIAPEQVTDSRRVDVRADLYALGCTLFKLLTGCAPFAEEKHGTAFAKMTAHVSEAPPSLGERLPGAPAALVRLVDSMLAKDPSKRPSSPDVVAKALTPLAVGSDLGELVAQAERAEGDAGFEVSERRPQESRRAVWWRRRVPVWGLVAAGLIGVVIGFACGITITIRTPDGSKMTMTVPDGSEVEIDSTGKGENTLGPAMSSSVATPSDQKSVLEHQERLQGVWRLVSQRGGMQTQINETLFIFNGVRLSKFHDGNRTESGTFSLSSDDQGDRSGIRWDLLGGRIELLGFARFADDENVFLEFTAVRAQPDIDGRTRVPSLPVLADLERIGDVPRTEAELNRLSEGRPETIREALQTYQQSKTEDKGQVGRDPFNDSDDPFSSGAAGALLELDDTRRSGAGTEPSLEQMLQADQGYWRVVRREGDGESLDGGITRVVVRGDRLYLLDEERIVAEGKMALPESGSDSRRDELIFRDELHGWSLRVRTPINKHGDPFAKFDAHLFLIDFEDLSEASVEDLRDVPYDVPQDLYLTQERGSDLAKAEALFRELRSDRNLPSSDDRSSVNEAASDAQAKNQLKQIGLAFHNFHAAYRKLPASAGRKEGSTGVPSGKETYPFSWRVALLPFLEQNELFEQYRFEEPWDSEHNLTLVPKMPEVYRSPFADTLSDEDGGGESEPGQTHYLGFAGELSALGQSVGNPFSAFRDGTSNTLLVVESQASVPWTKPEDLPYETAEDAKRAKPFPGQPLRYLGADGAVHSMDPVDWEELAKWITRDGGEVVER